MRNIAAGNKKIFSGFILIIILIIVLLIVALVIGLKQEKKIYEVSQGAYLYDENYELIELESDGTITKKWNGKYYLVQSMDKKEYSLGKQVVVYEASQNRLNIYGDSYQIFKDAKVDKIAEKNEINNLTEDKFYKLDDRKYLVVGGTIKNDKGTISTKKYLMIEIDKSGNTLVFNYEIDTKTINPMIIKTSSYEFDIANEKLIFGEEEIDLKKIIGSTNEYEEKQKTDKENKIEDNNNTVEVAENNEQAQNANLQVGTVNQVDSTTTTTINNEKITNNDRVVNNQQTINNNGNSDNQNNSNNNNGNQNNNDSNDNNNNSNNSNNDESNSGNRTPLVKNVSLRSLIAKSSYIDVEYSVTDPENLYRTVYIGLKGDKEKTIALDKEKTSYRITDLTPNTTYKITLGYKEILSDNTTQDVTEDVMIVRTTKVQNYLNITKITKKNITFNLKLDSNYAYDSANLVLYVDGIRGEELAVDVDKATTSSGWTKTITYDSGREIILKLEDAIYNGKEVESSLQATAIME